METYNRRNSKQRGSVCLITHIRFLVGQVCLACRIFVGELKVINRYSTQQIRQEKHNCHRKRAGGYVRYFTWTINELHHVLGIRVFRCVFFRWSLQCYVYNGWVIIKIPRPISVERFLLKKINKFLLFKNLKLSINY